MATSFPLPALPLEWSQAESWLEQFGFYSVGANIPNNRKKATFLANCGVDAYNLIRSLILPISLTEVRVVFDEPNAENNEISIVQTLSNHLRPRRILHYERYKFFNCFQKQRKIQEFVADLRTKSSTSDFADLKDALLLTQFIIGLNDSKLREKFLSKIELTFEQAIQEALLFEESSCAASSISNSNELSNSICSLARSSTEIRSSEKTKDYICNSCGLKHSRLTCKFKDAKCYRCGKLGHISKVCQSSSQSHRGFKVQKSTEELNSLEIHALSGKHSFQREFFINGHKEIFLIDTGSPVSIIPENVSKTVCHQIHDSNHHLNLRCYSGNKVHVIATSEVDISEENTGKSAHGEILIVKEGKCILGCDFIERLDLISLNAMNCFGANTVANFHLKGDLSVLHGRVFPPRSLSHAMKLKVEEDIRDKLRRGILVPCEKPLVSAPIVPVIKSSGAVRVCGDYSMTANKIIDCGSYHIPSFDEIVHQIGHARVYSRIDLKEAYLQIPLSEQAQRYTTISTHLGYFSFTRLPFGISVSPSVSRIHG